MQHQNPRLSQRMTWSLTRKSEFSLCCHALTLTLICYLITSCNSTFQCTLSLSCRAGKAEDEAAEEHQEPDADGAPPDDRKQERGRERRKDAIEWREEGSSSRHHRAGRLRDEKRGRGDEPPRHDRHSSHHRDRVRHVLQFIVRLSIAACCAALPCRKPDP